MVLGISHKLEVFWNLGFSRCRVVGLWSSTRWLWIIYKNFSKKPSAFIFVIMGLERWNSGRDTSQCLYLSTKLQGSFILELLRVGNDSSSSIKIVISYSDRLLEETYLKNHLGTNAPRYEKNLSLQKNQNAVHQGYVHRSSTLWKYRT